MMLLLVVLLMASPRVDAAHPRWMVGDRCYPTAHLLRLKPGDSFDGDEVTNYRSDGTWSEEGAAGTWRIVGNRLIETRISAEAWALGKGERVRQTWTSRFVRHGQTAVALHGGRTGWSVRCP